MRVVPTLDLFPRRKLRGQKDVKSFRLTKTTIGVLVIPWANVVTCYQANIRHFGSPVRVLGGPWTHINMHRGSSTVDKIQKHWTEFRKLWGRLEEIANFAIPLGVAISIEWPRGCRYWNNPNVVHFLEKYGFKFADFDGCMYGLVASHGKGAGLPIKKPCRVAYVSSSLGEFLNHK